MLTRRLALAFAFVFALGLGRRARRDRTMRPPRPGRTAPLRATTPISIRRRCSARCFAVAANEAAVDESALRYYASLHNIARVKAEIPPAEGTASQLDAADQIYSTAGSGNDEQPFWDLLAPTGSTNCTPAWRCA